MVEFLLDKGDKRRNIDAVVKGSIEEKQKEILDYIIEKENLDTNELLLRFDVYKKIIEMLLEKGADNYVEAITKFRYNKFFLIKKTIDKLSNDDINNIITHLNKSIIQKEEKLKILSFLECELFKRDSQINPKTQKPILKRTFDKYVRECKLKDLEFVAKPKVAKVSKPKPASTKVSKPKPASAKVSKPKVSSKLTKEECKEFAKTPEINPRTKKGMYRKTFDKYVEDCNLKNLVYSAPVKSKTPKTVSKPTSAKVSKTPKSVSKPSSSNKIDKTKLIEGRGGYTVVELKNIAKMRNIDIKGLTSKSDIVKRIRENV
jgi:cell division septation protein DedD